MYSYQKFPLYDDFFNAKVVKKQKKYLEFCYNNSFIEGEVLEYGVYQGKTINQLASLHPTTVYGFDSFKGLPEDWYSVDGTKFRTGHFALNKLPRVKDNVKLIKGWFNETIPIFLEENKFLKIKLLHIDCDLYSSAFTVLDLLNNKIVAGTVIVFDELANWKNKDLFSNYQEEEWLALKNWTKKYDRKFSILSRSNHCQASIKIN